MVGATKSRKDEWEKKHVQCVLDHHNQKHGTHIVIKGKTTEVYPYLEGQLNWDWVCCDRITGCKVAVEVKRLTDSDLEERQSVIWRLLGEVCNSLSGKLPGAFLISLDIPRDYRLPFKRQPRNKQLLKKALYNAILQAAQELDLGEEADLLLEISKEIPFTFPDLSPVGLHKVDNEGSCIVKSAGMIGWDSINFDSAQLEEFGQMVSRANVQLGKSNASETFLVLIEEGFMPKNPPEITEAFMKIERESYSKIKRVYFVRNEEVTEIYLPTP